MNREHIHRLALLATARIAFVATSGCHVPESTSRDRAAEPTKDEATSTTAASIASTDVATVQLSTPSEASTQSPSRPGVVPRATAQPSAAPTLVTRPKTVPRRTTPAVAPAKGDNPYGAPAESATDSCEQTAVAALAASNVTPEVQACCDSLIKSATADRGTGHATFRDVYACCQVTQFGSSICSPWGPPAPPRMPKGWA